MQPAAKSGFDRLDDRGRVSSGGRWITVEVHGGHGSSFRIRQPVGLMPGRYVLSFWLGDIAGDHHVELEALTFEITERDLWGLGQLPPPTSFLWWPTTYRFSAES